MPGVSLPTANPSGGLNPMSFSQNQHGNGILERLRQQRATGQFCDVILLVEGRQFAAHRTILAAASPYFDSILRSNKVVKEQVTVNCQNAEFFELLLDYMYSGSVVVDRNSVVELLKLANNFLVTRLKSYCAEYLDRYLDASNCFTVRHLAERYNMPGLLKNACVYLEANINRCLIESLDTLEFPASRVEALLTDNYLEITHEVMLKFIVRWTGLRVGEREAQFKHLLSFVQLAQVPGALLSHLLDSELLFQTSDLCSFALLQAMYECSMPLQPHEARYQALLAQHSGEVNIYFNSDSNPAAVVAEPLAAGTTSESSAPSSVSLPAAIASGTSSEPEQNATSAFTVRIDGSPNGVPMDPGPAVPAYVPSAMPVVKQEAPEPFFSQTQLTLDASQAHWEIEPTSASTRAVVNEDGQVVQTRPPLKLTLRLPVISKKTRILGKQRSGRPSAGGAAVKRRGRPPKADRLAMGDGVSEPDAGVPNAARAEVLFKCPYCIYTSMSQARIQAHIERSHTRNRSFDCNICGFGCKWNREFYAHMKQHFSGPPFQCDTCDYSADRIQMLLTHRMKHTDERPFTCTVCDYRCRTKTNLAAHARSHSGEKPFACPECGRGFAIKSTLDQHLATHSSSRPFGCDQCSFSTKYQSHLISHKRIHTGDVFHCQYTDCAYSSPKKSQLAAHLRTHLAVRAHQCSVCDRSFIEKSHLVRHERIHLAEKPFKCEHCDYASSRRDKLKEHIQKHHSAQAGARQRQRRYRRVKQLALKTAAHSQRLNPAKTGFRPINPAEAMPSAAAPLAPPPPPPPQSFAAAAGAVVGQSTGSLFSSNLLSLSPLLSRPSSAFFPSAVGGGVVGAAGPSPALSLNFNLGYETPPVLQLGGRDVLLSTAAPPALVTPTPRSPHSTTTAPPESLFGPNTPTLDLQRPMSLPPLGAQPSQWPQSSQDFSFTAMF